MKTKILFICESSTLNTGYGVYCREILKRLYDRPDLEVAEFASYIEDNNPKLREIPWKVYGNLPNSNNIQEIEAYKSDAGNQFGQWKFESVCLDFMPHVCLSIRDYWMDSYIGFSPFRKNYKWIWMPTVDARNQDKEWLSTYAETDAVLTYQDWSFKLLNDEGNGCIPTICSAPACANTVFKPIDKKQIKSHFGLNNVNIIGTVMRNQRRKLFPTLFKCFREYLNKSGNTNSLLYCHTSYPDRGWNIPQLLIENGLSSKVLFTYVCANCKHAFPSFFNDALSFCPKCHNKSAGCANVQNGVTDEFMSILYNLFDLYIQISNSEGFGMPIIEAAACGTPCLITNYSAMEDLAIKLKCATISCILQPEVETGCLRAIPKDKDIVDYLLAFSYYTEEEKQNMSNDIRAQYEQYYQSWDRIADIWYNEIIKTDIIKCEQNWKSKPHIAQPHPYTQEINKMDNLTFARWLILKVLNEPQRLNSYMEAKLVRDLNYGTSTSHIGGLYYNELSQMFTSDASQKKFNREIAYRYMEAMCNRRNIWEQQRWQKIKSST